MIIVLLHVLIALTSMITVSYAYARPSALKLRLSYGLIAGTLLSGTYLVVKSPAHMLETCTLGLAYTAIVLVGVLAARVKLARFEHTTSL
jgi:hypothetical protein